MYSVKSSTKLRSTVTSTRSKSLRAHCVIRFCRAHLFGNVFLSAVNVTTCPGRYNFPVSDSQSAEPLSALQLPSRIAFFPFAWREPPRRAESMARGGRVDGLLLSEALTPAALTGRTVASDRGEINGRGGATEDRSDKPAELLRRRCSSPAEEPRLAAAAAFDCARSFLRPSPLRGLVCVFLFFSVHPSRN